MATNWNGRTRPNTSFSGRPALQSDLGAGLDYDDSIMTDEDDNVIIFHTGEFSDQDTEWTGRTIP